MIVCALLPRLSLLAAVKGRRELLGEPVALAPEPGRRTVVGEASSAAEALGVIAGMAVGEALARCPELRLVAPDPDGARTRWARALDGLEQIGAAPESDRPGEAFFASDGLRELYGGRAEGVLAAARRALPAGVRLGAGPSRFCSHAAAARSRPGRPLTIDADGARAFLAPLPVGLLRSRPELEEIPDLLERLGLRTLAQLADLPAAAVSERFGHPGLLALDLARGRDTPLQPRRPPEPVTERLDLPEAASGPQLERALELLLGRLLARPERRGRALRSLVLTGRFVEGGTWRRPVTLRTASADPERLRLALVPRLVELPAPAESLGLEVEAFGAPAHEQEALPGHGVAAATARQRRIGEAIRQTRQAAGEDAALRVLEVDPDSRVPERRAVLAPYPAEGPAAGRGTGPGPRSRPGPRRS